MDEKYEKIIEMGRALPRLPDISRIQENLVQGCQSILYLETAFKDGKIYFNADSEALISKGLAALLIRAYSGETQEAILKCPPTFLTDIGIQNSLSPARSNGLASLFLKMKQACLQPHL